METNPLICRANQWTVFNIIGTSVMKELNTPLIFIFSIVKTFFLKEIGEVEVRF